MFRYNSHDHHRLRKQQRNILRNQRLYPTEKVELTISAAASLTDAFKEIQTNYETKNKQIKLNFNFGASGALQQQIEQGAPADLFFRQQLKI